VNGGDEGGVRDGLPLSSPFLCRGVRDREGAGEARQSSSAGDAGKQDLHSAGGEARDLSCHLYARVDVVNTIGLGGLGLGEYRYCIDVLSQIRGSGCYQRCRSSLVGGREGKQTSKRANEPTRCRRAQTSSDGRGAEATGHARRRRPACCCYCCFLPRAV
jgi:hypothetical protein